MIEKRYIISDAAKMVEVESHVLRYWEDELGIVIPRNEMGHRYYTDFYIDLLRKVKELKDSGFQLKAIKLLIPSLMEGEDISVGHNPLTQSTETGNQLRTEGNSHINNQESDSAGSNKMQYFRQIMGDIVLEAVRKNNEEIKTVVEDNGRNVSDSVIKQVDYLLRIKEEREEERFKKMDEIIRNYQQSKKEAAMTREKGKKKRWGK
ncbi:MAG: MerR family transcriptional regulator [Lachnospiraceae bacterium]|nr:MerR family transcriptional regulator [Lachnospiraceae bacterium]